jgi:hypothetical protein
MVDLILFKIPFLPASQSRALGLKRATILIPSE